jgi:hypothetical protein
LNKTALAAQQLWEGYDYTVRTVANAFIAQVSFIDWLQNAFIPTVAHLRERTEYGGKVVMIVDGHATHVLLELLRSLALRSCR